MRVDQFRLGLAKLAAAFEELKAREAAADLALLDEFLSGYDEQSVAACLAGIRKRLEDRPPAVRKAPAAADPTVWQTHAANLAAVRGNEPALRSALAALDADKRVKLPDLKAIARQMGLSLAAKGRPKAMQELTTALLRSLLEQHRLDLVGRTT
jgi:hypothetical protein